MIDLVQPVNAEHRVAKPLAVPVHGISAGRTRMVVNDQRGALHKERAKHPEDISHTLPTSQYFVPEALAMTTPHQEHSAGGASFVPAQKKKYTKQRGVKAGFVQARFRQRT